MHHLTLGTEPNGDAVRRRCGARSCASGLHNKKAGACLVLVLGVLGLIHTFGYTSGLIQTTRPGLANLRQAYWPRRSPIPVEAAAANTTKQAADAGADAEREALVSPSHATLGVAKAAGGGGAAGASGAPPSPPPPPSRSPATPPSSSNGAAEGAPVNGKEEGDAQAADTRDDTMNVTSGVGGVKLISKSGTVMHSLAAESDAAALKKKSDAAAAKNKSDAAAAKKKARA